MFTVVQKIVLLGLLLLPTGANASARLDAPRCSVGL
jgi:hypothetical protein